MKSGLLAILIVLLVCAASGRAAEFTLAWDPHEMTQTELIGYNLYYKANASILADPDGSTMIHIPLEEPGFDPDHPNHTVTDLQENTVYYFTVTAMLGDDESGMSNEVSAGNGAGSPGPTSAGDSGCFINALQ
jgi:hypothetical protein